MEASGATGFWSERRRTVREVVNTVPFALCGAGLQVAVRDPAALTAVDLYTVKDEYVPAETSLAQSVWQWLQGERKQGLRDVEEMLVDGTHVTGYGELVRCERGLELRPPPGDLPYILTTRSEAALLSERRRRERAGAAVPEAVQCVVCLSNPREVVVAPCQHVCLCVDCEERLDKRCCPVCRRDVTSVLPVYLA
ncbi:mitochondrial E3 ubiquitin protein ligase 1-like [Pollicipes pollicipes]|uniref:mitochondrial E3 ubiquitin protein ligase 1-like n=1 Tax=Pollicipes pollicipes TaxID=41117 RepID=UPI001885841A|nr:mitochondrial E3 ubiquitin protein ligase 1-like [Pollicipes pollicipes]